MKRLISLSISSIVLVSGLAFAHSDKHKKMPSKPVAAEQKEFGIAGDPAKVTRTITMSMSDIMRFDPSRIQVKQGETVKFIVKNNGKIMHEMVIGTMQDIQVHAELMKKHPGMEHDEPHMAHVQPGKTEEIVWQFNRPGEFNFVCLVAGHFEAGMIGKVSVK